MKHENVMDNFDHEDVILTIKQYYVEIIKEILSDENVKYLRHKKKLNFASIPIYVVHINNNNYNSGLTEITYSKTVSNDFIFSNKTLMDFNIYKNLTWSCGYNSILLQKTQTLVDKKVLDDHYVHCDANKAFYCKELSHNLYYLMNKFYERKSNKLYSTALKSLIEDDFGNVYNNLSIGVDFKLHIEYKSESDKSIVEYSSCNLVVKF